MTEGKIKPEKVEAYRCPVCKMIIEGNYKKASEHANQPVHEELPLGLVYLSLRKEDLKPAHYEKIWTRDFSGLDRHHSPGYSIQCFFLDINKIYMHDRITTAEFKERFKEGRIRLLTQEEFEEFCRLNPKDLTACDVVDRQTKELRVVRTTSELEEMVSRL